jgi:tetratricopeptide (TPR) repeat protein
MELTVDQALQHGVAAHKAGKLQDAERLYRGILHAQPKHPDANHNLGLVAVAVGKPLEAIPFFKLALETNSKIEQFWLSYIDVLITLERVDEAQRLLVESEKTGVFSDKLDALKQRLKESMPNDRRKIVKAQTLTREKSLLRKRKVTREKYKAHHQVRRCHKIKSIAL